MQRMLLAASIALAWLALPNAAQAQPAGNPAFEAAFGRCADSVCVVRDNMGGDIAKFEAAAEAVRAGAKRLVVIDGRCYSACAIFADIARERVCVTNRASFGFHKSRVLAVRQVYGGARQYREIGREDPPHSRDIAGWVYRNGGYPVEGYRRMNARQASQFWRPCS